MEDKKCSKCQNTKTLDNFTKDKKTKDGYRFWCKECSNSQKKLYYLKNADKLKKSVIEYRKSNIEKVKERNKKWRDSNNDLIKKNRIKNLRSHLLRGARLRAENKNLPFDISLDDILIPEICPVLGIQLKTGQGKISDTSPSLDRIIPEKGYVKGNMIVVSSKANRIKSNALPEEIIAVGEFYKKLLEEANKNE
jgi:hypothetical protein